MGRCPCLFILAIILAYARTLPQAKHKQVMNRDLHAIPAVVMTTGTAPCKFLLLRVFIKTHLCTPAALQPAATSKAICTSNWIINWHDRKADVSAQKHVYYIDAELTQSTRMLWGLYAWSADSNPLLPAWHKLLASPFPRDKLWLSLPTAVTTHVPIRCTSFPTTALQTLSVSLDLNCLLISEVRLLGTPVKTPSTPCFSPSVQK